MRKPQRNLTSSGLGAPGHQRVADGGWNLDRAVVCRPDGFHGRPRRGVPDRDRRSTDGSHHFRGRGMAHFTATSCRRAAGNSGGRADCFVRSRERGYRCATQQPGSNVPMAVGVVTGRGCHRGDSAASCGSSEAGVMEVAGFRLRRTLRRTRRSLGGGGQPGTCSGENVTHGSSGA